jgi:hypothetical protein
MVMMYRANSILNGITCQLMLFGIVFFYYLNIKIIWYEVFYILVKKNINIFIHKLNIIISIIFYSNYYFFPHI